VIATALCDKHGYLSRTVYEIMILHEHCVSSVSRGLFYARFQQEYKNNGWNITTVAITNGVRNELWRIRKFTLFVIIAAPLDCTLFKMTRYGMKIVESAVIVTRILCLCGQVHTPTPFLRQRRHQYLLNPNPDGPQFLEAAMKNLSRVKPM
jgi:hypothetical protein